ncbi:MAG TPA: glycoside hydrolase family 3 C-terminal domain-containing protein [Acidimicrobiales bacterium]|nr:glycoside hydrolase family 3 C-terminal domain-containing protein [Acidimicrobiales bacterium]
MPGHEEIAQLTLEEKVLLTHGDGLWSTAGVPRLGIPPLRMTDGPAGARGVGLLASGTPTLCLPCGSALGATWHPELVERLGRVLAEEARAKRMHVLLAPTVNLHRSPLGGRDFECYAEEPFLSGKLAAAFVRGVQSGQVATTVKHFVANDAEYERTTISSVLDERTLREVYLLPFELAVKEGGAWGVMTAYNRLNGVYCSEHAGLIDILRDEWAFDGFVVSDWEAARSTVPSARAGLDLEMPGSGYWFGGGKLEAAVTSGELAEAVVDGMVDRLLTLRERTKAAELADGPEGTLDRPEDRALARLAAAEATVLLKNDGLLPLDRGALRRLAVIGPNAGRARIMGNGSAALRPYHRTPPLEALRRRLPDVDIVFERGCDIDRTAQAVHRPFEVEYFASPEPPDDGAAPLSADRYDTGWAIRVGSPTGHDEQPFSARARATLVAEEPGRHELTLLAAGRARLAVDGRVVLDAWAPGLERGKELFGLAVGPLVTELDLEAGQTFEVTVDYASEGGVYLYGFVVGLRPPPVEDLVARAVAAAASADVALVVVGTSEEWEGEGSDRESFELPGAQDELVASVVAANPRTVVALNTGSPVAMGWADEVAALLQIWFGGQEMAEALVDVLLGEQTPSGKLPTTIPYRIEHTPSYLNFPGENSELRYGEGLYVGHRFYEATDRAVRFPFGHGLSYTTFELGAPRLSATAVGRGEGLTVEVEVTNTGDRLGAETVQCYVAPPATTRLHRPPRELKAFAKVWAAPGETVTATLELPWRSFAYYDPGDPGYRKLVRPGAPSAGAGHERRDEAGWVVDAGRYRLDVATSSSVTHHRAEIEVLEPAGP